MQRSDQRRAAREEQSRNARQGPPRGPLLLGALVLVVLLGAGFGVNKYVQANTPPPTPVPTRTPLPPTSTPVPDAAAVATPIQAAFQINDRCVTTTLDPPPGPAHIRGGGLDIELVVGSLSLLSTIANFPADVVCTNPPPSAEAVDAMVQGIAKIEGVLIRSYTYTGG